MYKKLYNTGTMLVILWIVGYLLLGLGGYFHLLIPIFIGLFVVSENQRMRKLKVLKA